MKKKTRNRDISLRQTKKSILGLDCSSSTIGWGAINYDGKLVAHGHYKPLSSKYELLERLENVYHYIQTLCSKYSVDKVAIEDILLFMKNKSQARTITILAVFNRTAALAAKMANTVVKFYSVHEIRKLIKSNIKQKKIQKEDIPDLIRKYLEPQFTNVYNTKNKIANETYDEADGIAVAWSHFLEIGS